MTDFDIFIAIDPGVMGGISIIDKNEIKVYKIPVQTIQVNQRNKKIYDLSKIVEILLEYNNKKVLFLQESVGVMPNQGAVSAFNFGHSVGSTLGIAYALNFHIEQVSASVWKKAFPELESKDVKHCKDLSKKLRKEKKSLKDENKVLQKNNKSIKEKEDKKQNREKIANNKKEIKKIEKELEILRKQTQKYAKEAARNLASEKCPDLAENFKNVNSDGVAESLLMAFYAQNMEINE